MRNDAGEIAHRAGGHEQSGFAAKDLSRTFLQSIGGGVFDKNVVSDFSFRHRSPHFRGRFGYGVASEVDNSVGHKSSPVTPVATSQPAGVSFNNVQSNVMS